MKNKVLLFVSLLSLLGSGCSMFVAQKDDSVFYTLGEHSAKETLSAQTTRPELKIVNLLVDEVPAYADCPYIATKNQDSTITFSVNERWSSPLEDECTALLKAKLAGLLVDHATIISSIHADGNMVLSDYRLSVSFDDLIYNAEEQAVVIRCNWSLFDYAKKRQIMVRTYIGSLTIEAPTYENIVVGMRSLLQDMARDIANGIKGTVSN